MKPLFILVFLRAVHLAFTILKVNNLAKLYTLDLLLCMSALDKYKQGPAVASEVMSDQAALICLSCFPFIRVIIRVIRVDCQTNTVEARGLCMSTAEYVMTFASLQCNFNQPQA